MKEKLEKLLDNSYSPYSNFRTAVIVVMKDGKEICGVNVENNDYMNGCCAEQVAIASCFSEGYKKSDFDKLYLMSDNVDFITPCFLCRQLISEVFEEDKQIISLTRDGKEKIYKVKELCPNTFGEKDLVGEKYEG